MDRKDRHITLHLQHSHDPQPVILSASLQCCLHVFLSASLPIDTRDLQLQLQQCLHQQTCHCALCLYAIRWCTADQQQQVDLNDWRSVIHRHLLAAADQLPAHTTLWRTTTANNYQTAAADTDADDWVSLRHGLSGLYLVLQCHHTTHPTLV